MQIICYVARPKRHQSEAKESTKGGLWGFYNTTDDVFIHSWVLSCGLLRIGRGDHAERSTLLYVNCWV
jgi:hypothetical protein